MKINLPGKVLMIINNLQFHGYEAYAVGGCVRDSILARRPEDWDITTSARPEEIKKLFRRTVDTGIEHGTVTVLLGKDSYEVTTYRIDGAYEDGRHPKEVHFTTSLEEDLRRRDFTINAMAYNDEGAPGGYIWRHAGSEPPSDPLCGRPEGAFFPKMRSASCVRFGFPPSSISLSSRRRQRRPGELAPSLEKISAERIQAELVKLLVSPHPERIRDAFELGITKVILPEWDAMEGVAQNTPHHRYDVAEHTLRALKNVKRDRILRLTMLFHDMGKPAVKTTDAKGRDHFKGHALVSEEIARRVLRRLKFDNDTVKKVTRLVCYHDYRMEATPKNVRRAMNRIGVELFPYYLAVRLADVKAQSPYHRREKIENIVAVRELYQHALLEDQCVTLRQLAVSGRDLMDLGMKPGRELGNMLSELLEYVIDDPERNRKEILCGYVREKLNG